MPVQWLTWTRLPDTSVLSYCGNVEETYTQGPSSTVFNTECNIIPEFVREPADHTRMYTPEVDLTITCSTNDGDAVLGNTYVYLCTSRVGPRRRVCR